MKISLNSFLRAVVRKRFYNTNETPRFVLVPLLRKRWTIAIRPTIRSLRLSWVSFFDGKKKKTNSGNNNNNNNDKLRIRREEEEKPSGEAEEKVKQKISHTTGVNGSLIRKSSKARGEREREKETRPADLFSSFRNNSRNKKPLEPRFFRRTKGHNPTLSDKYTSNAIRARLECTRSSCDWRLTKSKERRV